VVAALAADAALLDQERLGGLGQERARLERQVTANKAKDAKLLDVYLDGAVPVDSYRAKAELLSSERRALELRLAELENPSMSTAAQVEARARTASRARVAFTTGDEAARKEVVASLLCNLLVEDGRIASYQYKGPFGVLERDSSGAFLHSWWPETDLNRRHGNFQRRSGQKGRSRSPSRLPHASPVTPAECQAEW
jgi:hypothetical protein